MPEVRNYHVRLKDGSERNVKAKEVDIDEGVLSFSNNELVVAYAPGEWVMVEVERQDDKG